MLKMRRGWIFKASALAVLPFVVAQAFSILSHDGSFIHFSKLEATGLSLVLALLLGGGCAILLTSGTAIVRWFRLASWFYWPVCLALLLALATLLDPKFWTRSWDPLIAYSPAFWMLATGLLAIGAARGLSARTEH